MVTGQAPVTLEGKNIIPGKNKSKQTAVHVYIIGETSRTAAKQK